MIKEGKYRKYKLKPHPDDPDYVMTVEVTIDPDEMSNYLTDVGQLTGKISVNEGFIMTDIVSADMEKGLVIGCLVGELVEELKPN